MRLEIHTMKLRDIASAFKKMLKLQNLCVFNLGWIIYTDPWINNWSPSCIDLGINNWSPSYTDLWINNWSPSYTDLWINNWSPSYSDLWINNWSPSYTDLWINNWSPSYTNLWILFIPLRYPVMGICYPDREIKKILSSSDNFN